MHATMSIFFSKTKFLVLDRLQPLAQGLYITYETLHITLG